MKNIFTLGLITLLTLSSLIGQDIYEPNNVFDNPTTLSCGITIEGYIQTINDKDWFEVQIPQSGAISVDLNFVPSTIDLNLEIYQVINGLLYIIANDDIANSSAGQNLTATAFLNEGTYLILIEDENNNNSSTVESYSLTISCLANPFEINQTIDLAPLISQDTCFNDNIWGENSLFSTTSDGDDDQDWFMVEIGESGILNTSITSVPGDMDLNLEIYTIENNQTILIADDDISNSSYGQDLTATAFIDAGTYYIHIEDENHNDTNEETFSFCVNFSPNPFEINQTIDLAQLIPQDTCFNDNIWGANNLFSTTADGDDDQDWFMVNIDTTCTLTVDLTNIPGNMDLNLEIYTIENNQTILVADDDISNSSYGQDLTATAFIDAGTYYIHIEDENHNDTNEETYSFCMVCEVLVGINELSNSMVEIFPNPSSGIFAIKGINQGTKYRITNLQGKVLVNTITRNNEINMEGFKPGLYIVTFVDEKSVITIRILKE